MRIFKITQKLILMSLTFVFAGSFHAKADSETDSMIGKIIAGAVIMGINEITKDKEQEQKDSITWYDEAYEETFKEHDPVITQVQYDQRTQDIQKHLKQLGFYNGIVDGVFGRQTLDAIYRWEAKYDQEINGEISDGELLYLKEQTHSGASISKNETSIHKDKKYKHLRDSYEALAGSNRIHQLCTDFINSGHVYSYSITAAFEEKSDAHIYNFNTIIDETVACFNLNDEQTKVMREEAQKRYEKTQEYKMYEMLLPMAVSDQLVAMDIVKGCNAYISSAMVVKKKFDARSIDKETCEVK